MWYYFSLLCSSEIHSDRIGHFFCEYADELDARNSFKTPPKGISESLLFIICVSFCSKHSTDCKRADK